MSGLPALLLVLATTGPSWLSVGASDGEPPVTIIEIPISPTTDPGASTSPTGPASDQPAPTTTLVEQLPTDTGESGKMDVDPVLVLEGGTWPWQAIAGISLILGGMAILSLRFVSLAFRGPSIGISKRESIPSDRDETPSGAVAGYRIVHQALTNVIKHATTDSTVEASGHFEALECCTDSDLDAEVHVRMIGEFSSPEEAIEAARAARSEYVPDPYPDAWWVVRHTEIKHAWWFAELGTEEESVIDLRSGRRSPFSGSDALLALSIPPDK